MTIKNKTEKVVKCVAITILIICCMHYARRIFLAERFVISSVSMEPTFYSDTKVWVNKMIYGARIYTKLNFEEGEPLHCFRLPGLRKIRPNDIVIFNAPNGYDRWGVIEFKINYVFCKRVLGTPGDSIGIRSGHYWNNHYSGVIGDEMNQSSLNGTPDSSLIQRGFYFTIPFPRFCWNVKEMGPVYVPQKGKTIILDDFSKDLYREIIKYETQCDNLDSIPSNYTFKHDYFFVVGDNATFSIDSRFWGFVPDDFIVGVVTNHKRR